MGKEKEIWKPVKGYTGFYEVSNLGNVRSLSRIITVMYPGRGIMKRHKNGRILKPGKTASNVSRTRNRNNAYLMVVLCVDGFMDIRVVHRMVGIVFVCNPDSKQYKYLNHKNKIKTDNRASNLEWVTNRENNTHAYIGTKTSSKYVGVTWVKASKKWKAQIRIKGKQIAIGEFRSEQQAADAYQKYLKDHSIINKFKLK